jgi:hypothetical protein
MAALFSWGNEAGWPNAPREYVFLARAFNEAGKAMFKEAWTGGEALPLPDPWASHRELKARRLLPITHAAVTGARPAANLSSRGSVYGVTVKRRATEERAAPAARMEEIERRLQKNAHMLNWREELARRDAMMGVEANAETLRRRNEVAAWIADLARNSALVTAVRLVAGSVDLDRHKPSVWNVEPDWTLFATCQCHLSIGWSRVEPHYIFFTRESFDRCLLLLAPSNRAKAEREAEAWLRIQFSLPETKSVSKPAFLAQARGLYVGLSIEAFDRAWGNATQAFPERRAAGRKKSASELEA